MWASIAFWATLSSYVLMFAGAFKKGKSGRLIASFVVSLLLAAILVGNMIISGFGGALVGHRTVFHPTLPLALVSGTNVLLFFWIAEPKPATVKATLATFATVFAVCVVGEFSDLSDNRMLVDCLGRTSTDRGSPRACDELIAEPTVEVSIRARALAHRAFLLYLDNQYGDALPDFQKASELFAEAGKLSSASNMSYKVAEIFLEERHDYPSAIKNLRLAIEYDSRLYIHNTLSEALYLDGNVEEALAVVESALRNSALTKASPLSVPSATLMRSLYHLTLGTPQDALIDERSETYERHPNYSRLLNLQAKRMLGITSGVDDLIHYVESDLTYRSPVSPYSFGHQAKIDALTDFLEVEAVIGEDQAITIDGRMAISNCYEDNRCFNEMMNAIEIRFVERISFLVPV